MTKDDKKENDKPPFFKSWDQMYIAVAVWQVFLIVLFHLFSSYY